MNSPKPSQKRHAQVVTEEDWEATLEFLSVRLCSKKELKSHMERKEMYARKGMTRVKMFPVWRRYRRKAARVARIHTAAPLLKRFPLWVSSFISDILEY